MKNLINILFASACIFFSCTQPPKEIISKDNSAAFEIFRQKFPVVQLPVVFEQANIFSADLKNYKKFDISSEDTLFLKVSDSSDIYLYGILSDTSRFYALLYLTPSRHSTPRLITYTKAGKVISDEKLIARGCASDCGVSRCVEAASIQSDFTIFTSDSSRYEYLCDVSGEELPGPGKIIVRYRRGQIAGDGKVELKAAEKVELEKGPELKRAPEPEGEW